MRKRILLTALIVFFGLGVGYFFFKDSNTHVPVSNDCENQLTDAIESARSKSSISVPAFSQKNVTIVHCSAYPGFLTFEITGTDTSGQNFHIYEKTGGKAASGGDSIFDYCYLRDGTVLSQTRVSGRASNVSTSTCSYLP
jgi:uncharacterized protein (UPF0333 family)